MAPHLPLQVVFSGLFCLGVQHVCFVNSSRFGGLGVWPGPPEPSIGRYSPLRPFWGHVPKVALEILVIAQNHPKSCFL